MTLLGGIRDNVIHFIGQEAPTSVESMGEETAWAPTQRELVHGEEMRTIASGTSVQSRHPFDIGPMASGARLKCMH